MRCAWVITRIRISPEEPAGWSKTLSSKAAASEEAKEVQTALGVGRSPIKKILANEKAPQ
jgi:hypothetical protein